MPGEKKPTNGGKFSADSEKQIRRPHAEFPVTAIELPMRRHHFGMNQRKPWRRGLVPHMTVKLRGGVCRIPAKSVIGYQVHARHCRESIISPAIEPPLVIPGIHDAVGHHPSCISPVSALLTMETS